MALPSITILLTLLAVTVKAASPTSGNQNKATALLLEELNHSLCRAYLYALLVITVMALFCRGLLRLNNHMRHMTCLSENVGAQRYFASTSPVMGWIKDHLLFAPLFHHRRASEIKLSHKLNFGTLPTRAQFIFVGFVITYNVFACFYNIPWSNSDIQALPVLRARTGTLSVVNFIPIVVMSSIKNPLINMLDISYDSFNLMHRWLGRLSILQAIAHTLAHCLAKLPQRGWKGIWTSICASPFLQTGTVAVGAMLVILFLSPKLIRNLTYEFFLHSHILLVAVIFAALWHHLEDLPQRFTLLAAIILWGVSRIGRLMTMIYRSFGRGGCKAVIEILPGDAMRIEFRTPRPWNFKSGQTLYLCIPSIGFLTSHPFSVAWSDFVEADGKKMVLEGLHRSASTRAHFGEKTHNRTASSATDLAAVELKGRQTFSLIVRKRHGFTAKLYDEVLAKTNGKAPLVKTALIEGPYGHAKSMSSYGTVLLFASGVGITYQIPYVRDLVDGYTEGTVAARRVTLVWVIRSTDCLEWVRPWMHEILAMDRRREVLRVYLYITKDNPDTTSASPTSPTNNMFKNFPSGEKGKLKSPSETVTMSRCRPDVTKILRRECQGGIGCVGVSVCAGGGLSDEVRRSTRLLIAQGYNADFVEEFYGW